jgi:hypothetical protein
MLQSGLNTLYSHFTALEVGFWLYANAVDWSVRNVALSTRASSTEASVSAELNPLGILGALWLSTEAGQHR